MPLVTDGSRRRSKSDVLAEIKRVLIGYLGPVLEPPGAVRLDPDDDRGAPGCGR